MVYSIFFLIRNPIKGTSFRNLLQTFDGPFRFVGMEYHASLGLRRISHFKPDIILMDSQVPYTGLEQYLSMIKDRSGQSCVILYRETEDAPTYEDPQIVQILHGETFSPQAFHDALNRACAYLSQKDAEPGNNEIHPLKSLQDWLEGTEDGSRHVISDFFHRSNQESCWISMFVYDQSSPKQINASALINYLSPSLQTVNDTYCFFTKENILCLITPNAGMHQEILTLLANAYGKRHFFYCYTQVLFPRSIIQCYRRLKLRIRLAYFEPPGEYIPEDMEKALSFSELAAVDRLLYLLLYTVTLGNHLQLSQLLDKIYLDHLKPSLQFSLRSFIHDRLLVIRTILSELSAVPCELGTIPNFDYLSQELFFIKERLIGISSTVSGSMPEISQYILSALYIIHIGYKNDLSLNETARQINVSIPYLSAQFKKALGISFNAYLTSVRMRKAEQLLSQTNTRIHEIAQAVGYDDSRYFSRIFHKVYGVTPTEFRMAIQQEGAHP